MILLRRGRQAQTIGSTSDVDVLFEFSHVYHRRPECYAPWRPPIEVFETEQNLIVRAEIGGLSIEEILVEADDEMVIIRGERTNHRPDEHRVYHESRVRYGPFEASVRLPFPIDIPLANADYVDGILTVILPRLPATTVPARGAGTVGDAQRGEQ